VYLASALLFVAGLKGLAKVKSAGRGNALLAFAMLLAAAATLVEIGAAEYGLMLGSLVVGAAAGAALGFAARPKALGGVALATAAGGTASALFALSVGWTRVDEAAGIESLAGILRSESVIGFVAALALVVALIAGAATASAGVTAYLRSRTTSSGQNASSRGRGALWVALGLGALAVALLTTFLAVTPETLRVLLFCSIGVGLAIGVLLAAPIAGRDLPAGVALIIATSGVAAGALGFLLTNNALLIVGGIVLAASVTLAGTLAEGMGRSLDSLLLGGGAQSEVDAGGLSYSNVRSCGVQEAAMVLEDAHSVVLVPGFGYAVAQAQHATRELAQLLEKRGAKVRYAVHPMAGRMPGHMNVLLSEADVPYAQLHELEQINEDFKATDVVIVLGGNDIVNPDAEAKRESPVYGMPILKVGDARTVFVVKRSLRPGYTGAKNPLFESENTMLMFGDAKKVLQSIATELKGAGMAHAA
jgi:NAD(P) transhydrogenase subunit beta